MTISEYIQKKHKDIKEPLSLKAFAYFTMKSSYARIALTLRVKIILRGLVRWTFSFKIRNWQRCVD